MMPGVTVPTPVTAPVLRRALAVVLMLPLSPLQAPAQQTVAVVGGTLIDGTGRTPVPDAVVVVREGRIVCAAARGQCRVPAGARRLSARGQWIIPGLVDAHVHFSQTGWFDGRPDAIDLRDQFPYEEVEAALEAHPERALRADICAGVTSVFDVGGYPWTWALRRRFATDPRAPRIAAAGPLLSTIDYWVNLPAEKQFIYMADDSTVRAAVRAAAAFRSDAVKIWYLMPPQPPDTARIQGLVRVTVEEATAHHLPVIVHATGLWEAKDAIRAGARVLVHSVFESPVDSEFIALAREHEIILVPTIMVPGEYVNAARFGADSLDYPLTCADSVLLTRIRTTSVPADARARYAGTRMRALIGGEVRTAMDNTRRLAEAGVPLAMGTDAGNPGTLHGPSVYREMELMVEAGLSPMAVLVASTRTGATALGRDADVGTIEAGKAADMVALRADPTVDIRNVQQVVWVMKGGVVTARR
jgi:imidazolonepropionase-like amidohydrolase